MPEYRPPENECSYPGCDVVQPPKLPFIVKTISVNFTAMHLCEAHIEEFEKTMRAFFGLEQ